MYPTRPLWGTGGVEDDGENGVTWNIATSPWNLFQRMILLHVESEIDDVAVLHEVILAHEEVFPRFLDSVL